jgi:hypothetical protein
MDLALVPAAGAVNGTTGGIKQANAGTAAGEKQCRRAAHDAASEDCDLWAFSHLLDLPTVSGTIYHPPEGSDL